MQYRGYTLRGGDCREVMKGFFPGEVDSIVTDPPYELGFMGKGWDRSGIAYDVAVWQGCLRVLKPGGFLLAFGGTRTYHRMACAIEDAGFEIRDQIQWIYGNGFPKNKSALKPAHEPIVVARKPIAEKTVTANVACYRTGELNIGACHIDTNGERLSYSTSKEVGVTPFTTGTTKQNPNGRWPANVIFDEEAAEYLDSQNPYSKSSDRVRHNNQSVHSGKGIYGKFNDQDTGGYADEGGVSRFFYCAKASQKERNLGCENLPQHDTYSEESPTPQRDKHENVRRGNNHPTVKPLALMRYLCRLVTPPDGAVLDPFMGSGSTICAAIQEGFYGVGIELSYEYLNIARARINAICKEVENGR